MKVIAVKKIFSSGILSLVMILPAFAQQSTRYPIIPKPLELTPERGEFNITSKTKIVLQGNPVELKKSSAFLITLIGNASNLKLHYGSQKTNDNAIYFLFDKTIQNEEGYRLYITPQGVHIKYKTPQGAFWAVQTFRQLMFPEMEGKKGDRNHISVPCVKIDDAPRFPYRGVMLDVARHLFPLAFIKKYIDLLAFYKINSFHLHLTDDQGWRVEIKRYPALQKIAAWRKETLIGFRTDTPERYDGRRYGGFYTQKELKELVQYAQDRFITIIPEIDIPGHSQSTLAAYPWLGCIDSTYTVSTKWGVHHDILCPTEETFSFLEHVFTEIMDIFPSKYIHIGGDEVPKDRWKESEFCQTLIKNLGLKDEKGLQTYFIERIAQFLRSHGREIIGWDEILEGGIPSQSIVMSWRGEKGGIAAATQQHQVIMTPSAYTYINFYQTQSRIGEPLSNRGYLPLKKVYGYDPIPAVLTPKESAYILGVQACLWTEYVDSARTAEFMTFPRLCALAEVGWTPPVRKNYHDFMERLQLNEKHLEKMDVQIAPFY